MSTKNSEEVSKRMDAKLTELAQEILKSSQAHSSNPIEFMLEFQFETLSAIQRLTEIVRTTTLSYNSNIKQKIEQDVQGKFNKSLEEQRKKLLDDMNKEKK